MTLYELISSNCWSTFGANHWRWGPVFHIKHPRMHWPLWGGENFILIQRHQLGQVLYTDNADLIVLLEKPTSVLTCDNPSWGQLHSSYPSVCILEVPLHVKCRELCRRACCLWSSENTESHLVWPRFNVLVPSTSRHDKHFFALCQAIMFTSEALGN